MNARLFEALRPWMERFEKAAGVSLDCGGGLAPPQRRVPHTQLRLVLQADPAMEALLPGVPGCVGLGEESCAPFRVSRAGLLLLPPVLVMHPAAAAVAARWGAEALHAAREGELTHRRLVALLRHGAKLLESCKPEARELMLKLLPDDVAAEFSGGLAACPSRRLCEWQAGVIEGAPPPPYEEAAFDDLELELPMEAVLIAGGDSRLIPDPVSGLNKYGVCPRPRPEAVHFSSSTASAVSEHGFLYADLLRRRLLDQALKTGDAKVIRRRMVNAVAGEILNLLGLTEAEGDAVVMPSGTDAELVSVMVALAGAGGRPLTNLLVSPEESGRGVELASAGRYFDPIAATHARIEKGQKAFGERVISVQEVAIRDGICRVRTAEEVDEEWLRVARAALEAGHHVLAHVLLGSKTGLSAPSLAVAEELAASAPGRVDVVVDACQMRSHWGELGGLVRKGWMLQVSGSKFLTGPPFSGALLLPPRVRGRAEETGRLLAEAPGVSLAGDWPPAWEISMSATEEAGSLGAVFRWLPALMEGQLYAMLTDDMRQAAFERFRAALAPRLLESPYVEPIGDEVSGDGQTDIGRLSIMAFQVLGRRADGSLTALNGSECQWLFEHLNRDISNLAVASSPREEAMARLCCHIGQPVVLKCSADNYAFLRLVLGARFFNFVGHAEDGAAEVALESEIADAKRVLGKIEWIAERWWQFQALPTAKSRS